MAKWVILGKPECPYCEKATDLLHLYDIEFVYMNVIGSDLYQFLLNCGKTTVPQVYRDGQLIGGYEDLVSYLGDIA